MSPPHAFSAATGVRGTFVYANPPVVHRGPGCLAERLDAELRRLEAHREDDLLAILRAAW